MGNLRLRWGAVLHVANAGDNELGQLGTKLVDGCLEPRRVQALEASTIVHVSVGLGHVVAVTDQVRSWLCRPCPA